MNVPFFIVRLKPDLSLEDCVGFINALTDQGKRSFQNLMIALPLIRLQEMSSRFPDSGIQFGADQLFSVDQESFTRPVASSLILEAKGNFVLIGIPEERNLFKLSLEQLKNKVLDALHHGLTPFYCLQESDQEDEELQMLQEIGYFNSSSFFIYQPDFHRFKSYLPAHEELISYQERISKLIQTKVVIALPFDLFGFSAMIDNLPFDGAFFTKSGIYPHAVHQESLDLFQIHNENK